MNMNRDRPTSEKSQRTGDTGGIRQSMSFYHLLREIQPTVKDKYSVITFVLTVVGSTLCFLPFYAYMILANNDNGQGGISTMSGLNLDTSIDYSVSMKNSVSSGNQDTDSALFHAINRYCSMLLVLTYSLITLFCYTLSHTSPSHITTSNKHQCLSVCLSVWLSVPSSLSILSSVSPFTKHCSSPPSSLSPCWWTSYSTPTMSFGLNLAESWAGWYGCCC